MTEWWKESAWMVHPKEGPYINPQTIIEILPNGFVKLTSHKVADFHITLRPDHMLAILAKEMQNDV